MPLRATFCRSGSVSPLNRVSIISMKNGSFCEKKMMRKSEIPNEVSDKSPGCKNYQKGQPQ